MLFSGSRKRSRVERELKAARVRSEAAARKVAELEAELRGLTGERPPDAGGGREDATGERVATRAEWAVADPAVLGALGSAPGLVFVTDTHATLQLIAGEGVTRVVEGPRALIGKPVTDLLGEGGEALVAVRTALGGGTREWKQERGGRVLSHRVVPLRGADGELLGVVGVVRDVSERTRLTAQLEAERAKLQARVEDRTRELVQANAELEAANEAKDRFLASMSHELRTPLNAIIGLAEALLEGVYGDTNEGQSKYLSGIVESGLHLLSLVNDILDIAKFQAGELELEPSELNLREVCEASVRMVAAQLERKRIRCELELDPEVDEITADERRLKQMLVNLLANAAKFSEPDSRIGVRVRGEPERGIVLISVWDEGPGIPPEKIELLFRPFVQLNSGSAGSAAGTGLGLSIVLSMAELHGGSVAVESELGQGSEFTISLPWGDGDALELGGAVEQDPRWDINSFAGQTLTDDFSLANTADIVAIARKAALLQSSGRVADVLVIDDNEANTRTLGEFLRLKGFEVHAASNGLDGVNEATARRPKIIILDMQMPGVSGLEVLRRLRMHDATRAIPVVALSALALPGERRRCLTAGASEYLGKPVQLSRLESVITRLIE